MNDRKQPRVGLALGSGSARGLAHVGVLQALEEAQIPIDCIGGCSMGAVIGSIYAAGTDLNMLAKICVSLKAKAVMDLAVPRRGLVKGVRFAELIRLLTKDQNIEDFQIPFCCVACDIREGKTVTFTRGKAYQVVRASMSIPAVFEPCILDGVMYVDGAVLDAVPVESVRRELGADIVIAVDVGYKGGREETRESPWDILMRTLDLMGWEANRRKSLSADVIIRPSVRHTAKYSNADAEECIRIGYETAKEAIPEIQRVIAEWRPQITTSGEMKSIPEGS